MSDTATATKRPTLKVKVGWTKDRYYDRLAREEGYVWLQEVGYCKAKPLAEFKPGEHIGYNYGSTAEVVELLKNGKGKVVGVRVKDAKGKLWDSTRRATTLLAWAH